METLILAVIAVALVFNAIASWKMAYGFRVPVPSKRDKAEQKEEKPDLINEGFENIMCFAVKGKTGFEMDS